MAITVANLVAQVGADLTQFKLGMNEVDARLAQVKVRGEAAQKQVASMRAESARLSRVAENAAAQRTVVVPQIAASRAAAKVAMESAKIYKDAWDRAAAAQTAALKAGNTMLASSAAAVAATARAAYRDAQRDANAALADMRRLQAEARSLGRTAKFSNIRSGRLAARADTTEDLSAAANDVAEAYALRRAQDAQEHRVRAFNNIADTAIVGGTVGIAGLGMAAKVGGDFSQMLLTTAHNTQLSKAGIDAMITSVKQLGLESGEPFDELAHSFRLLTDYGNDTAKSQVMLRTAMKASVATGADLATTTELLAKATKEFSLPIDQSAKTMSIMIETGRRSTLTMDQMVDVGGKLYATAANLGVSFIDANAALLTFTQHGLDASQAATQLTNDVNKITHPVKQVRDLLGELDKMTGARLVDDFSSVGLRARHIQGVFSDIVKVFDELDEKQKHQLKVQTPSDLASKLFPNLRGTVGAVVATGTGFIDFQKNVDALTGSLSKGADIDSMYQQSLQQLNQQLGRLQNSGILAANSVTHALLPSLMELMNVVNHAAKEFDMLPVAAKDNIVNFVALSSVGLILFGVIGKIIVGVTQLKTAFIEMGVAESLLTPGALAARFGPWGIAIAGVTIAAGYLIDKYQALDAVTVISKQQLDAAAAASEAVAKAHYDQARAAAPLVQEYEDLRKKTALTKDQSHELYAILGELMTLAPDLISGYDKQGDALGLIGDAASRSAAQLRDYTQAALEAAQAQNAREAQDNAFTLSDRKTDIQRMQWSARTGLVPDRDPNGGWKWDYSSTVPDTGNNGLNTSNPYARQNQNPWSVRIGGDDNGMVLPYFHQGTPTELAAINSQLSDMTSKTAVIHAHEMQIDALMKQRAQHLIDINKLYERYVAMSKTGTATQKAAAYKAYYAATTGINNPDGSNLPWTGPPATAAPNYGDDTTSGKNKKGRGSDPFQSALDGAQEQLDSLRQKYFDMTQAGDVADIMWDRQHGKLADLAKYSRSMADALYAQTLAQAKLNDETKRWMDYQTDIDAASVDIRRRSEQTDNADSPHKALMDTLFELTDPGGKYAHIWNMAGNPKLPGMSGYASTSTSVTSAVPLVTPMSAGIPGGVKPAPITWTNVGGMRIPSIPAMGSVEPMPPGANQMNQSMPQLPPVGTTTSVMSGFMARYRLQIERLIANANAEDTHDNQVDQGKQFSKIADAVNKPLDKVDDTPQAEMLATIKDNAQAYSALQVTGQKAYDVINSMGIKTTMTLKDMVASGEDAAHIVADIYALNVKAADAAQKQKDLTKSEEDESKSAKQFLLDKQAESVADLLKANKGTPDERQGAQDAFLNDYHDKMKDTYADPNTTKEQKDALDKQAIATFNVVWANTQAAVMARKVADANKEVNDGLKNINDTMSHNVGDIKITDQMWALMTAGQKAAVEKLKQVTDIKKQLMDVMQGLQEIVVNSLDRIRQHGFKGAFTGIVQDFDTMLYQLAAKWLASQFYSLLLNQIPWLLGQAFGAAGAGGGGGGMTTIIPAEALGGPLEVGKTYLLGENGPEHASIDSQGRMRITPTGRSRTGNSSAAGGMNGGNSTVIHAPVTVYARDAQSFASQRTQSQIAAAQGAAVRLAVNRNR